VSLHAPTEGSAQVPTELTFEAFYTTETGSEQTKRPLHH